VPEEKLLENNILVGDIPLYGDNPLEEAKQWVKGLNYLPNSLFVVYGIGLGYEIRELLSRMRPEDKIIIVEPSDDITGWFRDRNPDLQGGKTLHRVKDWGEFKRLYLYIGDFDSVIPAVLPGYQKVYQKETERFMVLLGREISNLQSDQVTTDFFHRRWQENVLRNLRPMTRGGSAAAAIKRYHGAGVLVSAGPSLTSTLPLLDRVKGKALIVAVQTANRVFETMDVKPDLIATFDGAFDNYYEHFSGIALDVPLVFDPTAYWRCVSEWRGPLSSVLVHPSNRWIETLMECQFSGFASGPSIANFLFDLLYEWGADPIILIGQDLAYTGGRFHAKGTHKSELWDCGIPPERKLVEVDGVGGGKVVTDRNMVTFLHWYEEMLRTKYTNVRAINATGPDGAEIHGTVNMPFEEAIQSIQQGNVDEVIRLITTPVASHGIEEFLRSSKNCFIDLMKDIKRGQQVATELVYYYANNRSDEASLDRMLKELSGVDDRITESREYLQVVQYMIRPLLCKSEYPIAERGDGLLTARRSMAIYTGLSDTMEAVIPILEEVS